MRLERANLASASFDGVLGKRILANQRHSLLAVPVANPAMVTMFDHTRTPRPGGEPYLWWSGEFAGKYLISAVQDLRMSHDEQLERTVADVARALIGYQGADGYLGPFDGNGRFGDNWDVWGHYHCVLGLYEWFRYSQDASALEACEKATQLIWSRFGPPGNIRALRFPSINSAFAHVAALLYQEVGDSRYLGLVHAFEQLWTPPPAGVGDYVGLFQSPRSLYSALGSHARGEPRWERLHSFQALGELFRITGDERYLRAFTNIWRSIRDVDRHSTGGFSALERATSNPFDPRPIETCCTITWMALSIDMLRLTGLSEVADELELSTWNAVLGAQCPDGTWWTYNTPMGGISTTGIPVLDLPPPLNREPSFAGYRQPTFYDIGFQDRAGASSLSCCAQNAPRGLGMLSEWGVMSSDDGIAVNFYGPSRFDVLTPTNNRVSIEQQTAYPAHGAVELRLTVARAERFALRLRIPAWSTTTTVAVNGIPDRPVVVGTYHVLDRTWQSGDTIQLSLDLRPRTWVGGDRPANSDPESGAGARGRVALYRGPILLAYDQLWDQPNVGEVPPITDPPQLTLVEAPQGDDDNRIVRVRATTQARAVNLSDFATAGMPRRSPFVVDLDSRVFQLRRQDGPVLARQIRLLPNGNIDGYLHASETRWGWEGGTPVFYASDGRASTRFVWHTKENGRLVLRGVFEFDRQIVHELRELDLRMAGRRFQFCRAGGPVIAERLRLRDDHSIEGYDHANERRWEQESDTLVFRSQSGQVTTRFTEISTLFGRVDYRGTFLLAPGITHELRELDTEVVGKIWQFRRPNLGSISIRLLPGGVIEADHPNESFWGWEADQLVFYNAARTPTTRFRIGKDSTGRIWWKGPFLLAAGIEHQLVEWNVNVQWGVSSPYISWLPFSARS